MVFPQLIPTPYRMLASIIAILLTALALIAFGWSEGADHVQGRWDKAKAGQLQQTLEAEQAANEREAAYQSQLRKANHDAEERQAALAADIARLDDQLERVRRDRDAMRARVASLSAEAARRVATACLDVHDECAERYGALAKETGRIVSECQSVIDAWPK